jgi:hypothetical protein
MIKEVQLKNDVWKRWIQGCDGYERVKKNWKPPLEDYVS